ncbi:hypothetical protein Ancab_035000 [Ancistrocladus abbreviatus]
MDITEEPILSRLDRLDHLLRHLEEIRGCNRSPKSSCASTPSSGTLTSEGARSSVDFSPKSLEKHCRPIEDVIVETEHKGTLIERVSHLEVRLLKLCLQLEEDIEAEKKMKDQKIDKTTQKKGLKQLVKYCVKGKAKSKHKST